MAGLKYVAVQTYLETFALTCNNYLLVRDVGRSLLSPLPESIAITRNFNPEGLTGVPVNENDNL